MPIFPVEHSTNRGHECCHVGLQCCFYKLISWVQVSQSCPFKGKLMVRGHTPLIVQQVEVNQVFSGLPGTQTLNWSSSGSLRYKHQTTLNKPAVSPAPFTFFRSDFNVFTAWVNTPLILCVSSVIMVPLSSVVIIWKSSVWQEKSPDLIVQSNHLRWEKMRAAQLLMFDSETWRTKMLLMKEI